MGHSWTVLFLPISETFHTPVATAKKTWLSSFSETTHLEARVRVGVPGNAQKQVYREAQSGWLRHGTPRQDRWLTTHSHVSVWVSCGQATTVPLLLLLPQPPSAAPFFELPAQLVPLEVYRRQFQWSLLLDIKLPHPWSQDRWVSTVNSLSPRSLLR